MFEPLGMGSSSYVWQERFGADFARPHDDGKPLDKPRPAEAYASWSLQTTAGDYAAFVAAVLRGDGLKESTWRDWFVVRGHAPRGAAVHLESTPPVTEPGVGWGLGWGLSLGAEPGEATFFQWGKREGVRSFVMGSVAQQAGLVLLTNSNTGLRLVRELAAQVLPGEHAAIEWLACVTE